MKRVFVAALCCAAILLFAQARAQAEVEFCPAVLHTGAVGGQEGKPAALYGFNLGALGPRTVQATLAFDTGTGWYTVQVPATELSEKDRRYNGVSASFTRRDYVSRVMYVRFPAPVTIAHEWVYSAAAQNDGPFGWAGRGQVTCDPLVGTGKDVDLPGKFAPKLDPKDADALDTPPDAQSTILPAETSNALEQQNCKDPFGYAMATKTVAPTYPAGIMLSGGYANSAIEIAIAADGSVMDAWVWGPSGYEPIDDSALRAAKASTYKAGRAYCRDVPGLYMFRVTFSSNN